MKSLSKIEAKKYIEEYFSQGTLDARQTKKIKKLAMSHRIRLKEYRNRFCKKCYSELSGKTRIYKTLKTIICRHCGFINRRKIK